jgi:hypothetical protein
MRIIFIPDIMKAMRRYFSFILNLFMGEILINAIRPPVYCSLVSKERINNSMTVIFPKWSYESNSCDIISNIIRLNCFSKVEKIS